VSPEARKLGNLQQRPFLSHVAAPPATLSGLKESFQFGTTVTAKVAIMKLAGDGRDGTKSGRWGKKGTGQGGDENPAKMGKICWISANPLKNGNSKIGVRMVIIVDEGSVAANLERSSSLSSRIRGEAKQDLDAKQGENFSPITRSTHLDPTSLPIKPIRVDSSTGATWLSQAQDSMENHQTRNPDNNIADNNRRTSSNQTAAPLNGTLTPDSMSQQMDYLTSCSSVQQNLTNGRDGALYSKERDFNDTPYSVD
jgi:hypothetical protein